MQKSLRLPGLAKSSLIEVLLAFLLLIILHFLWFFHVQPLPCGDGQTRLCRPVQSYLYLAGMDDFSHGALVRASRDTEYPTGYAILARITYWLGLRKLIMQEPFYLSFLLFVPLALVFLLSGEGWKPGRLFLSVLLFGFFPPVQLSLRSLSPHGFITIFAFAGIYLWQKGWEQNSRLIFIPGLLLLWLAVTIKHLGLWLACGFLFVFILWSFLRRENRRKAVFISLFFVFLCLPWYPPGSFIDYFHGLSYYKNLSHIVSSLVMALSVIGGFFFLAVRQRGKGRIFPVFKGGILLCFFFLLVVWVLTKIIVIDKQGLNQFTVILIFGGYFFLLFLVSRLRFDGSYGFWFLLFYVSFLNGAILYFSRFGYNAYLWYFSLLIALFLTIIQTENRFILLLFLLLFAVISNFFPPLSYFQARNHSLRELRSDLNFCTFTDHHLSWRKWQLRPLRDRLLEFLSLHKFPPTEPRIYGFTKFIDRPLMEQMAVFLPNWYQNFPYLETDWEIKREQALIIAGSDPAAAEKIFLHWAESGYISFVMMAEQGWSAFRGAFDGSFTTVPTVDQVHLFREYASRLFWDYLQKEDRLAKYYRVFNIEENGNLRIYLSKRIEEGNSDHLEQKAVKLNRSENFVSAQELFLESNRFFDAEDWVECHKLLKRALEIEPDHQEALKDLHIVEDRMKKLGQKVDRGLK